MHGGDYQERPIIADRAPRYNLMIDMRSPPR